VSTGGGVAARMQGRPHLLILQGCAHSVGGSSKHLAETRRL